MHLLEQRYLLSEILTAQSGLARVFFEYQWLTPQIAPENAFDPRTVYWHDLDTTRIAVARALAWDEELPGGLHYLEDRSQRHSIFTVYQRFFPGGVRASEDHVEHFLTERLMLGRGKDVLKGVLGREHGQTARQGLDDGYISLEEDEAVLAAQGEARNTYSVRRERFLANQEAYHRDVDAARRRGACLRRRGLGRRRAGARRRLRADPLDRGRSRARAASSSCSSSCPRRAATGRSRSACCTSSTRSCCATTCPSATRSSTTPRCATTRGTSRRTAPGALLALLARDYAAQREDRGDGPPLGEPAGERARGGGTAVIFTEPRFLAFFLVVFGVYWALRANGPRKLWLLAASCTFYCAWDWRFLGLLLFSAGLDYFVARGFEKTRTAGARRALLCLSLVLNLGFLCFFKYYNFFVESGAGFLRWLGLPASAPTLDILLPIGISFYTFQTLSYTIDVYRGKLEPIRRLPDFALFVTFFPAMVAGPIVRASYFLPQLAEKRAVRARRRARVPDAVPDRLRQEGAASRDHIAPVIEPLFATPGAYTAASTWIAAAPVPRADLLRLLGLLATWRSRRRDCSATRCRRTSTSRIFAPEHRRVLAALAHLALDLVPRLPLLRARRQQGLEREGHPDRLADHDGRRPVARRGLAVRRLRRAHERLDHRLARLGHAACRRARALRRVVGFLGVPLMWWFLFWNWILFRSSGWQQGWRCSASSSSCRAAARSSSRRAGSLLVAAFFAVHYAFYRGWFARLARVNDWAYAAAVGAAAALVLAFMAMETKAFIYFQF